MLKTLRANLRATTRAAIGIPLALLVVLPMSALQGFIVGPLTGNYNILPKASYNMMRRLCGVKIEFNAAAAKIEKERPTWFIFNHASILDFAVAGSVFKGTFAGKGDLLKIPGIAQMARAANYIGLRRSSEFNLQSIAKINKNFNAGYNTLMFPEATTTPDKAIRLFRAALLKLAFGLKGVDKQGNEVKLENDIEKNLVIQAVALRVKSVDGEDATGRDDLREKYAMYNEDYWLTRIWKRLQIREIVIELTPFEPMKPSDYRDEKELANAAAQLIASIVNPGQTTFEKAPIPGQPSKPAAAPV